MRRDGGRRWSTAGSVIVSSVVSSQIDLHARYGGVVPELAGRAHVELLTPVLAEALERGRLRRRRAPASTPWPSPTGPASSARCWSAWPRPRPWPLAWDVPLVGVNHLEAHLFASLLEQPDLGWPLVVLLVSGGHTLLVEVTEPGRYRLLGGTIDDAAGEAFDKVARFLGLGYPGGPAIDRVAERGRPHGLRLPPVPARARATTSRSAGSRPRWSTRSASTPTRPPPMWPPRSGRPWSTSWWPGPGRRPPTWGQGRVPGRRGGGQLACCARRIEEACAEDGIGAFLPSRALCTDNAAMVAAAGWWRLRHGGAEPPDPRRRPQPPAGGRLRPENRPAGRSAAGRPVRPGRRDPAGTRRTGCQTPPSRYR